MKSHILTIFSLLAISQLSIASLKPSFQEWYGFYNWTINDGIHDNCSVQFDAYQHSSNSGTCKDLSSCLLGAVGAINLADMTSASVILGLTPSILSSIGPSTSEIAVISFQRPVLGILLALGAPAVYPSRPGEYTNPIEALKGRFAIRPFGTPLVMYCVSFAQYAFALLAVTNILSNSIQLGKSTILSWKCTDSALPLVWSFLPIAIHLASVISVRMSRTFSIPPKTVRGDNTFYEHTGQLWPGLSFFDREFRPSANQLKPQFEAREEPLSVMVLSWLATGFGYIHVVFGTLVFSSLLFIGTLDAVGVLLRYIASAIVCRSIIALEITGMRISRSDYEEEVQLTEESVNR